MTKMAFNIIIFLILAVGTSGILGLDSTPRLHQVTHFGSEGGCPACDNPNSKCLLMSFIFTQPQMAPGYAPIATIPKDACYINITQLRPTRNHLALRNADGSYILNGNWAINRNGIYEAAGAKFVYHRPDSPSSLESITSNGPTTKPLEIMLVYRVPNPGVKYEYKVPSGVPIPMTAPSSDEKIAPPSIDLRRLDRPTPSQADEAPRINHSNRIPKAHRRKKYSWRISPSRTPCSKTCGGGVQSQIVVCIRESTQIPVHERRCIHSEKPDVVAMRCATQPCPARWVATWSPCSVTCGNGEQRRLTLDCKQEINSKLTIAVNEGACMDPKPGTRKVCHHRECDTITTTMESDEISSNDLTQDASNYKYWRTGPWSQCSATCDSGFRTRLVTCYGGLRPDDCPASQRPHSREHCETLPPCHTEMTTKPISITTPSTSSSSWLYTEWSQNCEDDCGTGSQYRRVACLRSGDTCTNEIKPETHRSCSSDRHCGGKWYTGPWGRCIDPCSLNPVQKREVLCIVHVKGQSRIVTERTCSISTRPESERRCHELHCPSEWFVGDWDVCNATGPNSCENAIQRREVRCLDREQRESNTCNGDTPPLKRSCEPSYCNNRDQTSLNRAAPGDQPILDNNCVDKIDRCRTAVQARLCQYEYYKNKCCLSCSRAPEIPRD